MGTQMRSLRRAAAVAAIFGVLAIACGDDAAKTGEQGGAASPAASSTTKAPQRGGSLTLGVFTEVRGVDPVVATNGSGSTGGTELGALFDRLLEWNPSTKSFVPKTAESVTSNADATEWTIKLRPNIRFQTGNAYDAAAVKFGIERQKNDSAVNKGSLATVKSIDVIDPLTAKVTLTQGWTAFPFLLSGAIGMIADPAIVQQRGKDFATNPAGAGAGPFEFVSFKPGEALVLRRNPNYWGGDVHLDELRFVPVSAGAAALYEAVKAGTLQGGYVRDTPTVAKSKSDGYPGYDVTMAFGQVLLINNGLDVTCVGGQPAPQCTGQPDNAKVVPKTPGQDPTVRRAIALAIDPAVVNERANQGKATPGFFDTSFPWNPNVAPLTPNADEAKRLVAQAKAAGWNGSIRLSCASDPTASALAQAIEAQLKSVGFDVNRTAGLDTNALVMAVITKRDYDLACWGLTASPDDGAQIQLDSFLRSTSASNRVGYKNPAMDSALDDLKRAANDAQKTAAFKRIVELWNQDVPAALIAALPEREVWSNKIHDVRGTSVGAVILDKAWLEQ
jgi:peptide/nickel transport system substrate-binding protein